MTANRRQHSHKSADTVPTIMTTAISFPRTPCFHWSQPAPTTPTNAATMCDLRIGGV